MRELNWRAEYACLNAWPALRSVTYDDWVLRFGAGLSRRSNSVNPLRAGLTTIDPRLDEFATLYRAQALPLIVRVLSLLDRKIDRELDRNGFAAEGETRVLFGDRDAIVCRADAAVEVSERATDAWLAAMSAFQQHPPAHAAIYRHVVDAIAIPAGFAALRHEGEIVAVAYAAIHDRLMCYESVVTDARHRGRGFAGRVMKALSAWGARDRVDGVCLQVAAENSAGLALYRSIGLDTELHRYHYRRESRGAPVA